MSEPEPETKKHSSHRISTRKKVLFSLVATSGFFLVLEGALTLLGVGRQIDTVDPYVGFDRSIPLMEVSTDDDGREILRTAANKLVWFNDQSFLKKKPAGTKRIFCLGGSTTFGRPFQDKTSYAGWLREFLPVADDSTQWEVINAGGVSYASYRVAAVMEELAQYEPDLFIVYSVHNEFLERRTYAGMFDTPDWRRRTTSRLRRTRTWSAVQSLVDRIREAEDPPTKEMLAGEVDEMLNHSIGPRQYHRDPQWRRGVLGHYETNLHRMVAIAQQSGAQILFVTPASNEKDCSPFKSSLRDGFSDEDRERFEEMAWRGEEFRQDGDFESALQSFREAALIDDRHALVHYEIGRALQKLERWDEAKVSFSRAIQEDICPLRAVDEIADSLRAVSQAHGVPLLDFEAKLHQKCLAEQGHSNLGAEYFLDHVHPTIKVHQQLAVWLVDAMGQHGLASSPDLTDAEIETIDARVLGELDLAYQGVAMRNLAKVLHWAGKFEEAIPCARDALTMILADPESRFVIADCLVNLGRPDEAMAEYERLFREGEFPRAYLPFGELLMDAGEYRRARGFLTLAAVLYATGPKSARAHYSLGQVHLLLQEYELAAEALEVANARFPDDVVTIEFLAQAYAGADRTDLAIEFYGEAIRLDPDNADLRYRVGLLMFKANQFEDAIEQFELAIASEPGHDGAKQSLEVARTVESSE